MAKLFYEAFNMIDLFNSQLTFINDTDDTAL